MSGLKVVPLDSKARVRRIVKKLAKDLDGAETLTYVVQRRNGKSWVLQSSIEDFADIANMLERAAAAVRIP